MKKIVQGEVARDRWGRPLIDGKPHTRTSTLAKALDETANLMKWKARMTAIGLASAPDLIALVSTRDASDSSGLNELVERACERAGANRGADLGTAIHSATELVDYGEPTAHLPAPILNDALAYRRAIDAAGLEPLCGEVFCVNATFTSAGTFDRLVRDADGNVHILDVKTGGNPDAYKWSGLAWAMQTAVYATAKPYDPHKGVMEWSDIDMPEPQPVTGIIAHIVQGTGVCRLLKVDVQTGLRAAHLATQVRELRNDKRIVEVL